VYVCMCVCVYVCVGLCVRVRMWGVCANVQSVFLKGRYVTSLASKC
jgi:hypothetical protein